MIQDEHSRSLNEQSTHSIETERQRSGLARMSAQYRLWASRSMEAQPIAGPSPSLSSEQLDRLRKITDAADNLSRATANLHDPQYDEKFGALVGQCDWYVELHRLLYEEE